MLGKGYVPGRCPHISLVGSFLLGSGAEWSWQWALKRRGQRRGHLLSSLIALLPAQPMSKETPHRVMQFPHQTWTLWGVPGSCPDFCSVCWFSSCRREAERSQVQRQQRWSSLSPFPREWCSPSIGRRTQWLANDHVQTPVSTSVSLRS